MMTKQEMMQRVLTLENVDQTVDFLWEELSHLKHTSPRDYVIRSDHYQFLVAQRNKLFEELILVLQLLEDEETLKEVYSLLEQRVGLNNSYIH